jgi:hypothetical protein
MVTPEVEEGIDFAPLRSGGSCTVVNDIKSAAQVVADLVLGVQAELHKVG